MKQIAFILALLSMPLTQMLANRKDAPVQYVTLKNGSVLYGYVEKNDGYGNFVFQTDSAAVYVTDAVTSGGQATAYEQLPDPWKKWAKAHGVNEIMFSNIQFPATGKDTKGNFEKQLKSKGSVNNVLLVERGDRYKYIEMTPNSYSVNWDDIVSIKEECRSKLSLSGIVCTLEQKEGSPVEGQYAGETQTSISIYQKDGMIETIEKGKVVKYKYRGLNPKQSILEQTPLLDQITLSKGSPVTGIIIEKNYSGANDEKNTLWVEEENGARQCISFADVASIRKVENRKCNILTEILLNPGEVRIEGKLAKVDTIEMKKGIYTMMTYNPIVVDGKTDRLTSLEVRYSSKEYGENVEAFKLVALDKKEKGRTSLLTFTDKSLATATYRPSSISTSENGVTTVVYQLNGFGNYVLFDANKGNIGYSFYVKKP